MRTINIGRSPWNKGVKGKQVAWNKGLVGSCSGEKNGMYKNGKWSNYLLFHEKLAKRKIPRQCEVCYKSCRPDFDHSHVNNEFRGWICRRCNLILGMAKDDARLLRNLAKYLDTQNEESRPKRISKNLLELVK